ncbi:MAG: hypothetical protein R6Y91_04875 [Desulfohalobium sp.]
MQHALERVRRLASQDKKMRFNALMHIYNPSMLREAYFGLKRDAAPGEESVVTFPWIHWSS